MTKVAGHKWEFKARFPRHTFGWRSQPAIARVKQAVAEIKKVAKKEPAVATEGAMKKAMAGSTLSIMWKTAS
jgi:hypothetical protein